MRIRTTAPLALSCAAVALAGCGSSSLLDGSSAQDLQQSLTTVSDAVDAGDCSEARKAARTGLQRVSDLPSSVDDALRSRLRTGFEELQDRIATDCESDTKTTPPVTTETTPAPTTETTPAEPAPETTPETTTPDETAPEDPTTTAPDDGSGDGGSGGTDGGTGTGGGTDDGGSGDDSGGVVPGVDGPGATERGVRRLEQRGKELQKRAEKAFRDLQKRARDARGQG